MAAKIRIVHIAEAPGGVQRFLVSLIKKMNEQWNLQFEHILICSDSYDDELFSDIVSEIAHVENMHNAINFKNDTRSIITIHKLLKKYQPDIVYCHSSKAGAVGRMANIGVRNRKGKKTICVYNAHGWSFNIRNISKKKKEFYLFIERVLSHFCKAIVCISKFEKRAALQNRICKEDKLCVINNGINFDDFIAIEFYSRKELDIPENAFVVGTIGRLARQKGPDIFVKMAVEIKKNIKDAFFVMVGDGREKKAVSDQVENAGMKDSFLITGWTDEPLRYLDCMDVVASLSRWEGFGLVFPEYMMAGKPIVSTKVDAIPDIIQDNVNGLLVPSEDYKAAADAVLRFYNDQKLRELCVVNGEKEVYRYDAARMAEEHGDLFYRLLNR